MAVTRERFPLAPLILTVVLAAVGSRILGETLLHRVADPPWFETKVTSMFEAIDKGAVKPRSVAIFGGSIPESGYPAWEVEKHLKSAGRDVNVYNLSVAGAGIRHQVMVTRELEKRLVKPGASQKPFRLVIIDVPELLLEGPLNFDEFVAFRIAQLLSSCGDFTATVPELPLFERTAEFDQFRLAAFVCVLGKLPTPTVNAFRLRSALQRLADTGPAEIHDGVDEVRWKESLRGSRPLPDPTSYARRLTRVRAEMAKTANEMRAKGELHPPYREDIVQQLVLLVHEWRTLADRVVVVRATRNPLFDFVPAHPGNEQTWQRLTAQLAVEGIVVTPLAPKGYFTAEDFFDTWHLERIHGAMKAAKRVSELAAEHLPESN